MLRFLIRRILGAIAVLFAISVLVFLIFNVVPATNPAQRIAGKNATPTLIKQVEHEWGFDKSLPAQYWTQMKLIFTGKVTSYNDHLNVDKRILEGVPATGSGPAVSGGSEVRATDSRRKTPAKNYGQQPS